MRVRIRNIAKILFAWLVIPPLLLIVAELTLRIVGVGTDTTYLHKRDIEGKQLLIPNRAYFQQFLSISLTRMVDWKRVDFGAISPKPVGTTRIVVLGESAVYGSPIPDFSFSRYLQVILESTFPERSFEVINTGIPGINSYMIYPMAEALLQLEPDYYVLYIGNNEGNPPYSQRSLMGRHAALCQPDVVRFQMNLLNTRLVQAGLYLSKSMAGNTADNFAYDNFSTGPLVAMERYRTNLSELLEKVTAAEVPVLLCTIGRNLVAEVHDSGTPPPADLEALPNQSIRELAHEYRLKGVSLVDISHLLRQYKGGAAPDYIEFFDPVHYTAAGNYAVASILYHALAVKLAGGEPIPTACERSTADKALALYPELEHYLLESFSEEKQSSDPKPVWTRENALREIDCLQIAAKARPHDYCLTERLIVRLISVGRVDESRILAQQLTERVPWRYGVWGLLAACVDGQEQKEALQREFANRPELSP